MAAPFGAPAPRGKASINALMSLAERVGAPSRLAASHRPRLAAVILHSCGTGSSGHRRRPCEAACTFRAMKRSRGWLAWLLVIMVIGLAGAIGGGFRPPGWAWGIVVIAVP